jgi:hypothetical protein
MCCETDGGKAELFGKIRIRPNRFAPIVLPELRYIVFNESDDILQLKYRAVCIDLEVESRGKTLNEAMSGLERSINHYIDLAISDFGLQEAYFSLMVERRNKSESREIARVSYGQAIEHRYKVVNENIKRRIRLISLPYYGDLLRRILYAFPFVRFYTSREFAI